MALIDLAPRVQAALRYARVGEAGRIAAAIEESRVVGVLGEGEVGKTRTVGQAVASLDEDIAVVRLDLDGIAEEGHAAFRLAKEISRARVGWSGFSLLATGALLPTRVETAKIELAELLGVDGLEEALREWPSGELPLERVFTALDSLAASSGVLLWIDHLEAPALTPRHPFDLDRFLWGLREMSQRSPTVRIVLSGREGIGAEVVGPRSAFHQQGRWLTLDLPSGDAWRQTGRALELPEPHVRDLFELLHGHPASMLRALIAGHDHLAHPYEIVQDLVVADSGLTARSVQHARTLHRLGGQVMTQIALGQRPVSESRRGRATPQEIYKVLDRLRLAGLVRKETDGWEIVNPLVAMALRGQVGATAG